MSSKVNDYLNKRKEAIIKDLAYYEKNMKVAGAVMNTMRDKNLLKVETMDEIDGLSEPQQTRFIMEKIVTEYAEHDYNKFKEILKLNGQSTVCNKLPGDNKKLENNEQEFYSATPDYSLTENLGNQLWNSLSKYVCYIRNIDSKDFVASGFIVGSAVQDPKTMDKHRFLLTSYINGCHDIEESNCEANQAVFGFKTDKAVKVTLIPKLYASDKTLNYMLLALEPSGDLEESIINNKGRAGRCSELYTIMDKEPKPQAMLMTCGYVSDKPMKSYLTKVTGVEKGAPEGVRHVGLGKCKILGGVCIAKDTKHIYAMSTSVEDESNGDVIQHRAAFIWDIIKDIKDKFQSPHCNIKEGQMDKDAFGQLFPRYK